MSTDDTFLGNILTLWSNPRAAISAQCYIFHWTPLKRLKREETQEKEQEHFTYSLEKKTCEKTKGGQETLQVGGSKQVVFCPLSAGNYVVSTYTGQYPAGHWGWNGA